MLHEYCCFVVFASLVYESPSADVGESLCSFSLWLFVHVYYIVFAQSYFHKDESSGLLFRRRSGRHTGAFVYSFAVPTCIYIELFSYDSFLYNSISEIKYDCCRNSYSKHCLVYTSLLISEVLQKYFPITY